ncbi:hypothetical protein GCM10010082_01360 [Kushneria pakistanensis]|uniref:DUF2244 domain-containing protein n=1 Tax=Kushneria pakistanensis TaxID=1508770 RepID=A0ABQ3F992_9GAMM|nr:hypothetical protein [Kushneria pakistanensis]GHC14827.1 hypothetical protein GCM10010082_01360 [Kushneria pakistanensis]
MAAGLYLLVGGAIALACATWLSPVWAAVVFVVLGGLGWQQAGHVPPPLRTSGHGQWEQYRHGQWHAVTLEVSRLGPLLCEVRIARRRYALWYDMVAPEQFRQLRRAFLDRPPAKGLRDTAQG